MEKKRNNDKVKIRSKKLIELGNALSDDISASKAIIYAEIISQLSDEEFERACKMVATKFRRIPPPVDFIAQVWPEISFDHEANEVAGRIITAISKFGYTNPDQAKAYIGDIGWYVIERCGSWEGICSNLETSNMHIFRAQCRDMAKAAMFRHKEGRLNTMPTFDKLINKDKLKLLKGDTDERN